jgi:hypothetical protein
MPERVADAIAEIARPNRGDQHKKPKSTQTQPCGGPD